MLKIYNTLAREKQTFVPIVAGKVSMYVCGMTVYDFCHLGHARVMVVFDMVNRWLRASGFDVTYVRNITDIDDKIIKRANENGEDISALTQRFIDAMDEDSAQLGVLRPDIEPRATAHIDGMIKMITALIEKGHTVLIIEHNTDILKCADWIIDLGPEGGEKGGELIFEGTPEDMIRSKNGYTAEFMKEKLGKPLNSK